MGRGAGLPGPPPRPRLRPAPDPVWPRPVPGCSESLEPGAHCAAGTLAPPGSPGLRRAAGSRTHEVRTRVSAAALPFRWAPRHPRTAPRGAEGAGRSGGEPRGRTGWAEPERRGAAALAGGRRAAGQRPGCGCGSVARLVAPPPRRARPAPRECRGSPGTGSRRPSAAQPGGAGPDVWGDTQALARDSGLLTAPVPGGSP